MGRHRLLNRYPSANGKIDGIAIATSYQNRRCTYKAAIHTIRWKEEEKREGRDRERKRERKGEREREREKRKDNI